MNANDGTLKLRYGGEGQFNNDLAGGGVLAFDMGGGNNALTFGSNINNGFTGTIALGNGKLDLDDAAGVLNDSVTLRLDEDGTAEVKTSRAIKGLEFNSDVNPATVLTVDTLTNSGGGAIKIDAAAANGIKAEADDYDTLFDYGNDSRRQKLLISAGSADAGSLTLQDASGYAWIDDQNQTRVITDDGDAVGSAVFGYTATLDTEGLYLGYGLSKITADPGKTVTLDTSGSTTPILTAQLTGEGGFTFTGTRDARVGNDASDYKGATAIDGSDGLTVTMLINNAFGTTSSGLNLINNGALDMDGNTQTVKELTGDTGTSITLGGLTVESGDFGGALTGSGSLTKTGSGTLTLEGTNTYTGDTTVSGGTLAGNIADNTNLEVKTGAIYNGAGEARNVNALSGGGTVTNFNKLTVQSGDFTGDISNGGSLTKAGDGTLTLTGTNTFGGALAIEKGKLVLGAGGKLAHARSLSLGGNAVFDFSEGTAPASIERLEVLGSGTTLFGGGKILDIRGKTLSFNIGDIVPGQPQLLTANGSLLLDRTTVVELANLADAALLQGQSATLADELATGSVFDTLYIRSGGFKYSLGLNSLDLLLTNMGLSAFRPGSDGYFTQLGFNNVNLQNGASHLDWLDTPGNADPALMIRLTNAFDAAYALGGRAAAIAVEQLYGGYAAYANAGLQVSGDRFRSLWQRRNASHLLDRHIFANLAASGVMSPRAIASPAYGPRDTVPSGHSRIWASGFGSWAEQNAAENLSGYTWDARGLALGYEYSFNNCLQLGFGAAYSKGELKVSGLRYENNPDILNLALYGVYAHPSGFHAQGGIGYGHAWNEYDVNMLLGGKKSGKYGSDDWSANLELGYAAKVANDFNLIPSIGVEYNRLRQRGWTETTSGNPALIANRFGGDSLAIPLGLRVNKLFRFGPNGGYAVPELRAAYVHQADNSRPSINAGYAGAPGSAAMAGVKPGQSYWRLGAGVSGRFNERVDFRVDYDFDARSGFRGHNLLASMGVSF